MLYKLKQLKYLIFLSRKRRNVIDNFGTFIANANIEKQILNVLLQSENNNAFKV